MGYKRALCNDTPIVMRGMKILPIWPASFRAGPSCLLKRNYKRQNLILVENPTNLRDKTSWISGPYETQPQFGKYVNMYPLPHLIITISDTL